MCNLKGIFSRDFKPKKSSIIYTVERKKIQVFFYIIIKQSFNTNFVEKAEKTQKLFSIIDLLHK